MYSEIVKGYWFPQTLPIWQCMRISARSVLG